MSEKLFKSVIHKRDINEGRKWAMFSSRIRALHTEGIINAKTSRLEFA